LCSTFLGRFSIDLPAYNASLLISSLIHNLALQYPLVLFSGGRRNSRGILASEYIDSGAGIATPLSLIRIPFVGGVVMIIYLGFGRSPLIATRLGSSEAWNLILWLEEDKQ
jgi:hypothetical protein